MAVAIGLHFIAGRYHGTPWGKHVNEGAVEWPPSPWRLLRSLVASWKHRTDTDEEILASVLKKLGAPPQYELPPATPGHTRHYMPLFKGDRTLVLDAFIALMQDAEVRVVWTEAVLSTDETVALRTALGRMTYMGRAESWCDAKLLADSDNFNINCMPIDRASSRQTVEVTRVLGVDPDIAILPGEALNSWPLCADTADLRKKRWSDPPGSRWLTYARPLDCFAGMPVKPSRTRPRRYTVARFALDGPVLPLVTETLSVGEFARQYLQGIYGRLNAGASSEVLSGKRADGERLRDHRHAFFLPSAERSTRRIDHITLYAKDAFGPSELLAFDSFRHLRQVGKPELKVVLVGVGHRKDFDDAPPLRKSRVWRSASPFVPSRHPKRHSHSPEDQVCWELEQRGMPAPVAVRALLRDACKRHWLQYRIQRLTGDGAHGPLLGYGFEIEFANPVEGPIALGYGCHFGLGQFHGS